MAKAFARNFIVTALTLGIGIFAAPDFAAAQATLIATVLAGLVAAVTAVQVFVPRLTFTGKYGAVLTACVRAGLTASFTLALGILAAPDLGTAKALATAGIIAVGEAIFRALQGAVTKGEFPLPFLGS